jgi:hypothetical protein
VSVANRSALLLAVFLAMPAVGAAQTASQTIVIPAPTDATPPVPLSDDVAQPSDPGTAVFENPNWWQPPVSHTTLPRWAIGHTVAFTTAGGVTLSAGFFGRQGDPLPLYLSEGAGHQTIDTLTPGLGSYIRQWDTRFAVSVPVWSNSHVKIRALGELFVPLTETHDAANQANPFESFLNARTIRFGLVTTF